MMLRYLQRVFLFAMLFVLGLDLPAQSVPSDVLSSLHYRMIGPTREWKIHCSKRGQYGFVYVLHGYYRWWGMENR